MRKRNIINIPGFDRALYIKLLHSINEFLIEKHGYGTCYEDTLTLTYNKQQLCIQGIEYDSMEYSDWMVIVGVRYFASEDMEEFLLCDDDFGEPYVKHLEFKLQDWTFFNEFVIPILTQMGWTGTQLVKMQKLIGLFSVGQDQKSHLTKEQMLQLRRTNTAYGVYIGSPHGSKFREDAYNSFYSEIQKLEALGISKDMWVKQFCEKLDIEEK